MGVVSRMLDAKAARVDEEIAEVVCVDGAHDNQRFAELVDDLLDGACEVARYGPDHIGGAL